MIDASDFGEEGMVASMDGMKLSSDKPTIGAGIKSQPAAVTATISRHDEYEDMEDDSLALDESTAIPGGLNGPTTSLSPPSSSSMKMVIHHFQCMHFSLQHRLTHHTTCIL